MGFFVSLNMNASFEKNCHLPSVIEIGYIHHSICSKMFQPNIIIQISARKRAM